MRNAIVAIYDELKDQGVSFDAARSELRKLALDNFRQAGAKAHESIRDIAADMLTAAFDNEALFSGNLDARRIRQTAKDYGFSAVTGRLDGRKLLIVKSNRNDLSHGNKSFSEVGRDFSTNDLLEIKRDVVSFMDNILSNVSRYIADREYLKS